MDHQVVSAGSKAIGETDGALQSEGLSDKLGAINLKAKRNRSGSDKKRAKKERLARQANLGVLAGQQVSTSKDTSQGAAVKSSTEQGTSAIVASNRASAGISKRKRESGSTPTNPVKVPRQGPSPSTEETAQSSYADAAKRALKVAIRVQGSGRALKGQQGAAIQKALEAALKATLAAGKFIPQFESTHLSGGSLVVTCANEASSKWLAAVCPDLEPWDGAKLELAQAPEVRMHKLLAFVPGPFTSTGKLLATLVNQNRGLNTSQWIVVYHNQMGSSGSSLCVKADGDSLGVLRSLKLKPYYLLGRLPFKEVGDTANSGV
ncbi:MAG: DUF4780 domain-containing protein [Gammaproteobacteria bacterium]|nr:DUF4780 domain-containing protein [Gammaproteobacteria bacterium]